MGMIIGMDPHKRSATIEVVDQRAQVCEVGRYGTHRLGYADMLAAGRTYPDRVWAIEGCNGIGKHIAHRLVHDGETVVDVPPKLSAQVRVFATGNGRKTDPVAGVRDPVELDPGRFGAACADRESPNALAYPQREPYIRAAATRVAERLERKGIDRTLHHIIAR